MQPSMTASSPLGPICARGETLHEAQLERRDTTGDTVRLLCSPDREEVGQETLGRGKDTFRERTSVPTHK